MMRRIALVVLVMGLGLGLASGCTQAPLPVAENVDLAQFQGQWFEIAKLPRATQADCVGTTAFYELQSDGKMLVTNQCRLGSFAGVARKVTASARVPDAAVPAKLSVDFGGFFGDYWILEVAPDYSYAVVGHPTRQYLWVLARGPMLDADTLTPVLARASANGFDVSRLEYTVQSP
jgi:apolipoprotein D and lipocalin family protein